MNVVERLRTLLGFRSQVERAQTDLIYVCMPGDIDPMDRHVHLEDALDTELKLSGIGYISGGGSMLGEELPDGTETVEFCGIDVEVTDVDAGRALLREHLPRLGCPLGTVLQYRLSGERRQDEYDGAGWALARPSNGFGL